MTKTFVLNTIILALCGVLTKAIGALYKIPLTNILGTQGIGMYYLIFPIFSIAIIICGSGVGVALCKVTATLKKFRLYNRIKKYLFASIILSTFLSIIVSIILIITCKNIAQLQGNAALKTCYIYLCPAIILSSLSCVLRGYFQGLNNMIPTSFSTLICQVTKLLFGLYLAKIMIHYGLGYAVLGAVFAITISELVGLIALLIYYIFFKSKNNYIGTIKNNVICRRFTHVCELSNVNILTHAHIMQHVWRMNISYTLTNIITPLMALFDSFFVVYLLVRFGLNNSVATSLYGIQNGVVATLIALPNIIVVAISAALMPSVCMSSNKNDLDSKVSNIFNFTIAVIVPVLIVMALLGSKIINILYGKVLDVSTYNMAVKMYEISCINIVYSAILHISISTLQSIDKRNIPTLALVIAFVVRTIVLIVFTYAQFNIFAFVISDIVFLVVASVICFRYVTKYADISISYKNIINVAISGVICAAAIVILSQFVRPYISNVAYVLLSSTIGIIMYAISMICLNPRYSGAIFTKIFKKQTK